MPDTGNADRQDGVSTPGELANTRREFLGATAGAGLAGSMLGSGTVAGSEDGDAGEAINDPEVALRDLQQEEGVFDIRDFGAVGDGETDNTEAVQDAVNAAGEWGDNPNVSGTVFVPPGDFRLFTCHLWHKHNGITITGVGFASKLKALFLPPDYPRDNDGEIGDHYRIFENNPSFADGLHPDEGYEIQPMNNVTIQNLQLEGQKDEYVEEFGEDNDKYSGHGFFTDPDGTLSKNIVLQNLWTHNFDTAGVSVNQANVVVDGLRSWNNNSHGLSVDAPGFHIIANNVIAWKNHGYGIDLGAARAVVSNFELYENDFGFKSSTAEDWGGAVVTMTNGKVSNSLRKGMQLTGVADRLFLDNIEFRENGGAGLDIHQGGELFLGQISSIDDNTEDEGDRRGGLRVNTPDEGEPMKVVADTIHVRGATGPGVYLEDGTELRVNQLESFDNTEVGLQQDGGVLTVHDGTISGNDGTSVQVLAGDRTVLKTLHLADDTGVDVSGDASDVTLRDIDATDTSTAVQLSEGVDARIEDVAGFQTAATGSASFSGGGGQRVFTIEHGLAVAPEYVNAVADGSSDAPTVASVQNVTPTSFDVEFAQPAPSGFLDEENLTVHWEASAF